MRNAEGNTSADRIICLLVFLIVIIGVAASWQGFVASAPAERSRSLDGTWNLWFDQQADWQHETPVLDYKDIKEVPVYPPSGGWDAMLTQGKPFPVPGTWDETYPRHHGVGWYWRTLQLPASDRGKLIRLKFWAVRLRAEVYMNRQLAGYSLEGSTPFQLDITPFVRVGAENLVAVRVTNPGGGTSWHDFDSIAWGNVHIPDSHDFGGIWQHVELLVTPRLHIQDVAVMPLEDLKTVRVVATLDNRLSQRHARLTYRVYDPMKGQTVAQAGIETLVDSQSDKEVSTDITIPDAQRWSPESPHLYQLETRLVSGGDADTTRTTFGIRFFTERDGKLFLNGRRVFVKSAINWSYYAKIVAIPSPAMVEKEIRTAKALGLNTLSCHRTSCTPELLDAADRLGLMIYEEPGGAPRNRPPEPRNAAEASERELFLRKVDRVVRRDRSHPALVWWNLANEAGDTSNDPEHLKPFIDQMMRLTHRLDPSRYITYTSARRATVMFRPFQPNYGLAFDYHTIDTFPAVWTDVFTIEHSTFQAPVSSEPFFNGESRSFCSWGNLPHLAEEYAGSPEGSYGAVLQRWDRMLKDDFQKYHLERYFKTPEELSRLIGLAQGVNVSHMMESTRLSDAASGIAFQGWDSHIGNFPGFWLSGIVDAFRDPHFPPELLARVTEPVHLAVVPLPSKVFANQETHVRIALINEQQVKGPAQLLVQLQSPDGSLSTLHESKVEVEGKTNVFVQDLANVTAQPFGKSGYYHLTAELHFLDGAKTLRGDSPLLVENPSEWTLPLSGIALEDPASTLGKYLEARGVFYPDRSSPQSLWQQVHLMYNSVPSVEHGDLQAFSESGRTLLLWADDARHGKAIVDLLQRLKLLPPDAEAVRLGMAWFGGWDFNTPHPIFAGLPAPVIYDQDFAGSFGYWGIAGFPGTLIAGQINAPPQVAATLGELQFGKSKIIICGLNLLPFLDKDPVATRIFAQMLNYAVSTANVSAEELRRKAAGNVLPDQ